MGREATSPPPQDLQIYPVDQSFCMGRGRQQAVLHQPAPGGSRNAADWGRQEQMAPRLAPAHADMVSTGPSGPACCWSGPGRSYQVLRRSRSRGRLQRPGLAAQQPAWTGAGSRLRCDVRAWPLQSAPLPAPVVAAKQPPVLIARCSLGPPGLVAGVQLDVVDCARAATMHAKSFGTLVVLHFLGGDDTHCNMASGSLPGRES